MRLAILFGGRSGEHEVSRVSATAVINAADRTKYELVLIGITKSGKWLLYDGPVDRIAGGEWEAIAEAAYAKDPAKYGVSLLGTGGRSLKDLCDFVIPVIHGPNCEDGKVQGLLELADVPYGGSGVTGSAVCMDKIIAKSVFKDAGLPVGPYVPLMREEIEADMDAAVRAVSVLRYPVFVKPANMGSSVGITKVRAPEDLPSALKEAAKHDRRLIVEQGVDGREIEISVWGNTAADLWVSCPGEISYKADFYDYNAKYHDEDGLTLTLPADIPAEKRAEMGELAKRAFLASDCAGFARCDFFLEHGTDRWILNEINTLPGCTSVSMFPLMWMESGRSFSELVDRIVELGIARYAEKNAPRT